MSASKSVRKILLAGVFWRILIIEAILLVWSLLYRILTEDQLHVPDLAWYALRIIILIAIILFFMMVTLRKFLDSKIISPLEAIASANRRLHQMDPNGEQVDLPQEAPREIREIVKTRKQMLTDILEVSQERLRLANIIRDTFGRYLSKKVVNKILASPEEQKIGGRREIVTILMSDLRGFTALSENRDPEEMVRLLNRYLEQMSKVILKYDGMIDEFIGDAILTIFGVPERHADDPARAVACGLEMQNTLMELNREIVKEGYSPLEMGIGINTGTVIVGNIGSELRAKYGIVGSAVNVAARIESHTTGGQVVISEKTYNLVKDLVTTQSPKAVVMKGLKKPLVSYPVTAMGAPYNVMFKPPTEIENGVAMTLPFHCWVVEDKIISEKAMPGETIVLDNYFITAMVDGSLQPLSDIKLRFDFCTDAHCFEDIYAKIVSTQKQKSNPIYQLRITGINKEDRDVLEKWIRDAS